MMLNTPFSRSTVVDKETMRPECCLDLVLCVLECSLAMTLLCLGDCKDMYLVNPAPFIPKILF